MSAAAKRLGNLVPYSGESSQGVPVRMHLNENYCIKLTDVTVSSDLIRRYPREDPLRTKLAEYWKLKRENIYLFNGGSEAIMCTALALCNPDDTAVIPYPEFRLISHYLKLAGAALVKVPFTTNMDFDTEAVRAQLQKKPRLFFASIPNNPTGASLPVGIISEWCKDFPETIFIIDEAYGSFRTSSMLKFVSRFENLLVIRSFSKDWGLAGLRLGAVAAFPALVNLLSVVRTPFSVNAAVIEAATKALDSVPLMQDGIRETGNALESLCSETALAGLGIRKGDSNFFLIRDRRAGEFHRLCLSMDVNLRKIDGETLRVSPSDNPGNSAYLQCLAKWRKMKCSE